MPNYAYRCACGQEWEVFYKTLPSSKLQKAAPCGECGQQSPRDLEREMREGPPMVNGGFKTSMAAEVGFAMPSVDGKPVYRDENGKLREVRSATDIDHWMTSNTLGKPRLTEWKNPITGETQMVPMRTRMIADPHTGEPREDVGEVVREKEALVKLDKESFSIPSESRSGLPIDPNTGVLTKKPKDIKLGIVDPETGRHMSLKDTWGKEPGWGDANARAVNVVKKAD